MQLAPIIARLSGQVSGLRKVEGVAALAALKSGVSVSPAAYVLPISEAAGENQIAVNAVSQRVRIRFGVILMVRNVRDPRGEEAHDAGLDDLRGQVTAALVGWEPDAAHDPCTYAGGRLLELADGAIWWQDEFITAHYLRA